MEETLDPKEIVSFLELLRSSVIEYQALIRLLEKKGVINRSELDLEIRKMSDKFKTIRE
jgi:hypothetical protein